MILQSYWQRKQFELWLTTGTFYDQPPGVQLLLRRTKNYMRGKKNRNLGGTETRFLGFNPAIRSKARQEQDVVALFHEMVGAGIFKGIQFLSSTFNERYDGLFELQYPNSKEIRFDKKDQPLGLV